METLQAIQSIEVLKDVPSSQLTQEDKDFCNTLFTVYSNHVTHVSELVNAIEKKNGEYENTQPKKEDQYFFSLGKIEKATEALKDTLEELSQSLVFKIENYFIKKYCLVFSSVIPDRGSINLDLLQSYDLIIENITGQVGNDLLEAGKGQIKNRFLKSFYRDSLPTLKGNKITIPDFISLDEHWGERISLHYSNSSRLENLINALNLFLNETTELPNQITGKVIEWKSSLDLSNYYPVFPGVSFKFFKNRRIDVFFSNAATARNFWNYYTLEMIGKNIDQND